MELSAVIALAQLADEPTARTLRRQEIEARQLGLALGDDADGLVFRLAVETTPTGGVERIVFLALRGDAANADCVWPIPLELPPVQERTGVQLRLIADDGYEGPLRPSVGPSASVSPGPASRRRSRAS